MSTDLIIGGRGSGRTTQVIQAFLAGGPNAVLVVISENERRRIIDSVLPRLVPDEAVRKGIGERIVGPKAHPMLGWLRRPEFYVDNADILLRMLLDGQVNMATWEGVSTA